MAVSPKPPAGVEFIQEDDGRVTARHVDSGVASLATLRLRHFGSSPMLWIATLAMVRQSITQTRISKNSGSTWRSVRRATRRGLTDVVRTTFSSKEVLKTLTKHGYVPVGGKGSHTTLRYENTDTGEVRTVTVPKADPIPNGTLHDIADQAGAEDFHEFCRWVNHTS